MHLECRFSDNFAITPWPTRGLTEGGEPLINSTEYSSYLVPNRYWKRSANSQGKESTMHLDAFQFGVYFWV